MFLLRMTLVFFITTFSGFCSAADYVNEARQYINDGKYRSAIIQLKNQLKNEPKDAEARYLLGKIYLQQSQFESADKELSKAVKLKPDNVSYKLAYSQSLLIANKFKDAVTLLDFSTDAEDENLRQVYLGYAYIGLNEIEKAKQSFQFAVKNNAPEGYIGLCKIAISNNDLEQAEHYIQQTLSQQPDNIEAMQLHAKILNIAKKHHQALLIYNQLIEFNSTSSRYYLQRASTYLALSQLDKAINDIQSVLSKNKNHASANYLLSKIELKQKNYKAAREAAQIVMNQSPHHLPSKLILGITNYALGNLNQADKYLTEYLSVKPEDINIQDLLANVYLAQKKPQQAILMLEDITEEEIEQYPNINTTLGSAYLLMGEHHKGIELLNKAKMINPDNVVIQKRLVAGQLHSGDRASGIAGLEKVAELEPDNKKVHYLLLISYIQDKKIAQADKKLEQLFKADGQDPVLYNFLSIIEIIKGNKEKARQAYLDALALDKNFIPAYMGLAKFAYAEGKEQAAVKYFMQVIDINPQYLASYLALASIAEKNKKNQQAEDYLLTAYRNNNDLTVQLKILSLLGKWYAKFKQPEKVLTLAEDLIKQHPEKIQAMSFLAGAQLINQQDKAAEKTLSEIVSKNDKDKKHRILLANLIAKQPGRQAEVLALLEEIYNTDTSQPQGLIFQVNFLIKKKEYQQAMTIAEHIEFLFPDKGVGSKLQGDVFWSQGYKDKAIAFYRKAYQKQPGVKSLFWLAELMVQENKNDLAIQFLKEELAAHTSDKPEYKVILLKLASTYQQLEDDKQAMLYYQKTLAIRPDNALALNNLAWIYFTQNNPKAVSMAEKAYKKAPKSPQVADTYAVILLEQSGQTAKALKILQQAALKAPNDYAIQFHLAKAFALSDNKIEALKILNLITRSEKDFSEKAAANDLLQKLM